MSNTPIPSGHAGYPAVKRATDPHYLYGSTANELFTLGSFYHGRIIDAGGQDDYIITRHMQGLVFISDADAVPDYRPHFYFDRGVEIVDVDTHGTGSVKLSNGGVVFIVHEDISYFHFGTGKAMDYGEFYRTVRAAIDKTGSYIVGSHVEAGDIDFDATSTATASLEGRDETNLMSLGSNHVVTATGRGGKDIYRLTRFQSQDATISDNSDDDLLIFEYGVQVTHVALPAVKFIGGSENAPAIKTLTIDFSATNVYQIGNDTSLRFKGDALVAAFGATGLPVDLGLDPHLREAWLGSQDLTQVPDGAGVLVNLSVVDAELNDHKVTAGSVNFYNDAGLLKDGADIYGYGVGGNAFTGSVHDNNVAGSEGDDFIMGNRSDNHLRGGGGSDNFVFSGVFGRDTITDFVSGTDTISINSDTNFTISENSLTVTVTDKDNPQAIRGTVTLNAVVKDSDIHILDPIPMPAFGVHDKFPAAFRENDALGLNNGAGIDLQPEFIPEGGSLRIVGIANGVGILGTTTADDFILSDDGILNLTSAGLDSESIGGLLEANTATVTVTIGIYDADSQQPAVTTAVKIRVTAVNDEYPRIDFAESLGLKTITVQEGTEKLATRHLQINEYDRGSLPHYTNRFADVAIEYRKEDNPYDSFFSFVERDDRYFLDVTADTDFESLTSDGVNEATGHKIFYAVFRMYDNGASAVAGGKEGRDTVTLLVSDVDDEDAVLRDNRGDFSKSVVAGAEVFSLQAEDKDMVSSGSREAFNFSLLSVTLNDRVIADIFRLSDSSEDARASLVYSGGGNLVAGDIYKFAIETEEIDSGDTVTHDVFLTVVDGLI